jgi:uncharacterized membrane protein
MLALFWIGAVLSAYLGYKLHDWWVPAAVAVVAVAGQFALFQMAAGGWGPSVQMIGYGLMDLVMFYATFGIGRSLGQRRMQRRKGVR